jgi:hypothetical protein
VAWSPVSSATSYTLHYQDSSSVTLNGSVFTEPGSESSKVPCDLFDGHSTEITLEVFASAETLYSVQATLYCGCAPPKTDPPTVVLASRDLLSVAWVNSASSPPQLGFQLE